MTTPTPQTTPTPPPQKTPRLDNHAFARNHKELWTFLKAFGTGLVGAPFELVSYLMLGTWLTNAGVTFLPNFFLFDLILRNADQSTTHTPAALVYAFIISTMIGQAITFVLSRKYAFRANNNVALATFFTLVLIVVTIIANGFVGPAIVMVVGRTGWREGAVQALSKLLSMLVSMAWRYPTARFVIHRVVNKKQEEK
ncbi:MAG: hypothetical protein FWE40_00595 [Oscillospiraceae bacterium]|nr:hypothetical protein [Oscillospiraceae bacterium]